MEMLRNMLEILERIYFMMSHLKEVKMKILMRKIMKKVKYKMKISLIVIVI
jgi:hypothetical protein